MKLCLLLPTLVQYCNYIESNVATIRTFVGFFSLKNTSVSTSFFFLDHFFSFYN